MDPIIRGFRCNFFSEQWLTGYGQRQDPFDGRVDADVNEDADTDLENATLSRARELRISGIGG